MVTKCGINLLINDNHNIRLRDSSEVPVLLSEKNVFLSELANGYSKLQVTTAGSAAHLLVYIPSCWWRHVSIMGHISNKISNDFLQIKETVWIVFLDWSFHCFTQIKTREVRSGELGREISLEVSFLSNILRFSAIEYEPCALYQHNTRSICGQCHLYFNGQ
jgi:hypothetical protein